MGSNLDIINDMQFTISDDATAKSNLQKNAIVNIEKSFSDRQSARFVNSVSFSCINNAILLSQQDADDVFNSASLINDFIVNLENQTNNLLRSTSSEDSSKFLQELFSIYQSDATLKTNEQRLNLLNQFLTQEQGILHFYILSEYKDRINSKQQNALSKVPIFKQFPENYADYLPINDISISSFSFLSSFFSSEKFQGVNKKILSVGIPPGLFRQVRHNRTNGNFRKTTGIKDNIVRLKVYRIDKLHPELVFLPISFMFEMKRFPTRILDNWDLDVLLQGDVFDPLKIPTKVIDAHGRVKLQKNYDDARKNYFDSSQISEIEFSEIYRNHSYSFLLEEYVRWLSEINLDEKKFYNYSGLPNPMDMTESQYSSYYQVIKNSPNTPNAVAFATFTEGNTSFVKSVIDKTSTATGNSANLTQTIKSYLKNETYFMPLDELKRQASYPKKFDRMFSVVFSPDEFMVDETNSDSESLQHLITRGIVSNVDGKYYVRDTSENDVSFDDYFVTIEPYDYSYEVETSIFEKI